MLFTPLKEHVMRYFAGRVRVAQVLLILLIALPCLRLAQLQIIRYEELAALSENNSVRILRVKADRGFIKDSKGLLLVKNAPSYEIEIVKEDVKNVSAMLDKLEERLPLDRKKIAQRLKKAYKYEPVTITRGLTFEDISYFLEHTEEYGGLQIVADPMRSYHDSSILSHTLGYISEISEQELSVLKEDYQPGDTIGKSGLEKQYEPYLRGTGGSRRVIVDSFGRVMDILSENPPTPGKNLLLTLDYELQSYIHTLMGPRSGAIVVLDNSDNSVLALYSSPSYNLDMFNPFITDENWGKLANDPKKPLLNRTIEGSYPPGSVFKILVSVAGLMEGVITKDSHFFCNGSFRISPRSNLVQNCWRKGGHGDVRLVRGIVESCDVYFYNLGVALGIDKLSEYSRIFGLGDLTRIDLPNEKRGVFPSREWKLATLKEAWFPGETANIAIGQGYTTTTPLQMAVLVGSIFNGGFVYAPRMVKGLEDAVTGERTPISATLIRKFEVPESVRKLVMEGLVNAVESPAGTSGRARVAGLKIGGKTGTAQVISLKRTENMKEQDIPEHWRDHSWFAGIYPSDKPRYTVVVLIEHGGSGGRSSAPAAGAIIEKMWAMGYR